MSTPVDAAAAHRLFSTHCFNETWSLLDQSHRSEADDREMLGRTLVSLWHWRQRADATPQNLSIGCWQASRVCAVLGLGDLSLRYANESLETAGDDPFYRGYALEARARAAAVSGQKDAAREHLAAARTLADQVTDADSRNALLADLATIAVNQ